jgi:outer membrane protein TolC
MLIYVFQASSAFGGGESADRLTLFQAVSLARTNNSQIREAQARSLAAVEALRSSRADLLPKASAAYGYARLKETPFMYFTRTTVAPHPAVAPYYVVAGSERIQAATGPRDNFHWEASLTQPLFTGFALITRVKMAQLGVALGDVAQQQAVADVVKQTKFAFFDVLMAGRYLETARSAQDTLQAHVHDATGFYDQGLIPYNDLLQSQVALAEAVQQRTRAEAGVEIAVAALNTVIGFDLQRPTVVVSVEDLPGIPSDLAVLLDLAEAQRPELRYLDLSLARLEEGARLAASAYYPRLALVGRYEQDGENWQATRNEFRNRHNTTVALQGEWTFFEWGKTRAEVAGLRREYEALAAKAQGVRDSIRLEVNNARLSLTVALANVQTAQAAFVQAAENLRINRLRYQQQVATSTEVLDATVAHSRAATNFHVARYDALKAEAELERAMGVTDATSDRKEGS